jgi:hypothetical protein
MHYTMQLDPTADQLANHYYVCQSRIPSLPEARRRLHLAVPEPGTNYPGTHRPGFLTSEFAQPIMPASKFIDGQRVLGLDLGDAVHVAVTDMNAHDARLELDGKYEAIEKRYQARLRDGQGRASQGSKANESEDGYDVDEQERVAAAKERTEARKIAFAEWKAHTWSISNGLAREQMLTNWTYQRLKRLKEVDAEEAKEGNYRSIHEMEQFLRVRQKFLFGSGTAMATDYTGFQFEFSDHLTDFYTYVYKSPHRRQTRFASKQRFGAKREQMVRGVITQEELSNQGHTLILRENHATRYSGENKWEKPQVPDDFQQPVIAIGTGPNRMIPGKPFRRPRAPMANIVSRTRRSKRD